MVALIFLAWTRLRRLSARFEEPMVKVRAGHLPAAPVPCAASGAAFAAAIPPAGLAALSAA